MNSKNTLSVLLFLFHFSGFCQSFTHKGDMSFYWGYNRSSFTDSDIHFKGHAYDFTLSNISANDHPTSFSFENYFKPESISIPQYVYRFSYFITDHWSVSIGMDHMKYIMPPQQSTISGEINQIGNPYNGSYDNTSILVNPDFLQFEHTDGLNYLSIGGEYFKNIYSSASRKFGIVTFLGAGVGLLIPKSNVTLMGGERSDRFHVAGFGLSTNGGVQFYFFKHFFLRSELKGGYIKMSDILTRPTNTSDRASQKFGFGMFDLALGGQWHLF